MRTVLLVSVVGLGAALVNPAPDVSARGDRGGKGSKGGERPMPIHPQTGRGELPIERPVALAAISGPGSRLTLALVVRLKGSMRWVLGLREVDSRLRGHIDALKSEDEGVRKWSVRALARMKKKARPAVPALYER